MTRLLPIAANNPGLIQTLAANTDVALAAPAGALALILWFETSAADATPVTGRVAFNASSSLITVDTDSHGYQPAQAVQYDLNRHVGLTGSNTLYLHIAHATANTVAKGMWLF